MPKPFRILSIDGGGIRGVLPGQVLLELEAKLQKKSRNPQARLADYFDLFAGTSTGGILICLYLFPDRRKSLSAKYSAEQAVNLYLNHGNRIFKEVLKNQKKDIPDKEKYSAITLEEVFQEYFSSVLLSELIKPCLITSYNILKRSTHFFTQHDAKRTASCDFMVRDIARATSAAPTYFEPARVSSVAGEVFPLIDGGVFANNPAMCAYAEALQMLKKKNGSNKKFTPQDIFILSIGTASLKRGYDYHPETGWGNKGFVPPVMDVLMTGAGDTVDFQMKQLFEAEGCPENYYRIDPGLGNADTAMDNASEKNLRALAAAGSATAIRFDKELEEISDRLLELRE